MGRGGERGEVEAGSLAYLVEYGCELVEEVLHVQETGLELLDIARVVVEHARRGRRWWITRVLTVCSRLLCPWSVATYTGSWRRRIASMWAPCRRT